jgi:tetratricopeptide (TPR) repeat protein
MTTASMRREAPLDHARRVDWGATAVWLLCFALVSYLGLKGGGYDPLVHDQVGIAIWWIVLLATAVGAIPRRRPGRLAWTALGLLAAFVLWTALSLGWTESVEQTWADLARVTGYLGVFAFAVFAFDRIGARRLVGAIAAAIVLVSTVALLSRFHPAWFPGANQTASFLSGNRERLSYPLHYWNGVAALVAIGLPLVFQVAADARSVALRALAAAALPALILTIFFTLSRGGVGAAAIALGAFFVFAPDRLAKLPTLVFAALGGAILILAADSRDALQHGLANGAAHTQGDQMLLIAPAVCVLTGLAQAAVSLGGRRLKRPEWSAPTRRQSLLAVGSVALIALVFAAALDAPGHASNAWSEFKQENSPGKGASRLGSAAGQNRYQLWSAAAHENATRPLAGTGSGTFQFWWAEHADVDEIVRDTHSLYMQTLGELGIVGLALLTGLIATVLAGGARAAWRAGRGDRAALAAALAGCAAFFVTATFDWMWQLPVLPVSMLLLAAALVTATLPGSRAQTRRAGLPLRVGAGAAAIAAIVVIAVPLASTALVRRSEADFREGDLQGALDAARSAQNAEPGAASPRLQQALVLEAAGELAAASEAAHAATERESTNWRNWLVLSRIEAERGRAAASVATYLRARSLNPRASIFQQ